MLAAFLGAVIGLLADPRTITGVAAWLKPAKFGISTAIFAGSIAWLFQYITIWPHFRRSAGWMLSIILIVEVGLIDLQAARGTTSHFNVGTSTDSIIFGIMGVAIGVLLLINAAIVVALFRQPFADRTWGWSLRLGMLISVLGASTGAIMVTPTAEQRQAMAAHEKPAIIGAHTVGAPDGGPGLPGVGWSIDHGDLRIPHFFGLHALQILPFLGWIISRAHRGTRLLFVVAGSYFALVGMLTWQALRGQSILRPDSATLGAFAAWVALTALAAIWYGKETYDARAAVQSV